MLECLRFALGAEVPQSRQDTVHEHLAHILGDAGRVRVLVKRADGVRVLIERSRADDRYHVTFEDDRREVFSHSDAIGFPSYILGWHEIEQAATDINIRRIYLDTISGREQVRSLTEEATELAKQVRQKHEQAANKYANFRNLHERVTRLDELRKGLEELKDAKLIKLKGEFELATRHREELTYVLERLSEVEANAEERVKEALVEIDRSVLEGTSPLGDPLAKARSHLSDLFGKLDAFSDQFSTDVAETRKAMDPLKGEVADKYREFAESYEAKLSGLTPEELRLLESHKKVMEQTSALPRLSAEREGLRHETEALLRDLIELCEQVCLKIRTRTELRQKKIEQCSADVADQGVKLSVRPHVVTNQFDDLMQRYRLGGEVFNSIRSQGGTLFHERMKRQYEELVSRLEEGTPLFFNQSEFFYFVDVIEEDDLSIEFDVSPPGAEQNFQPVDQLSSGQRCTAIFPVLLKLQEGPLVIDQPEDNLDNRHIAGRIAPALLRDKRERQIVFTSHNANLVVLSDAEHIAAFEGTGTEGQILERGFLATRESKITGHVLDIVDGGERALELRVKKYGLTRTPPDR